MKQETGSLSLLCSRLLGDVLFILNLLFCGFYPKGSKTINAQTKLVSNEKQQGHWQSFSPWENSSKTLSPLLDQTLTLVYKLYRD